MWQSEVDDFSHANVNLSVRPFTTYQCFMASFNSNGMGFFGTRVIVETEELREFLAVHSFSNY